MGAVVGLVSVMLAAAGAQGLTVNECVRLALEHSPAARVTAWQVRSTSAELHAALSAYSPRFLVQGRYGKSEGFDKTVTDGGSTAALVTVEATLLDGGLRDAQFAAARARLKGTAARSKQQRADVARAVRTAYFTALARREEVAIHDKTSGTLRGYVALLTEQERRGLVPHNDVLRAELAAGRARTARRRAAADLRNATDLLAALTGISVPATALIAPPQMPEVQDAAEQIDTSPIIIEARAAAQVAHRAIDTVRSQRRETLTLTASGGVLGVHPGTTFRRNGGGQFLLGFSIPVFDGGVVAARLASAIAAANAADASVLQSRQTLATALSRARVEADRAQHDLAAWRAAVDRSAENFGLMRARYVGGGDVRLLEVLDALSQFVDAQLNTQRALLSYRVALATQHQILGKVTL
ncbi:MAG: TolC family protein [Candidatus Binatia bacterium]